MTRTLVLLLAIGLSSPVFATTTWTVVQDAGYALAACTTGSEAAPTLVTQGLKLDGMRSITVSAEASVALTAASAGLKAYLWNPISAQWNRAPDLDLTTVNVTDQSWAAFSVSGALKGSRVAWVPDGAGQAVSIYIMGAKR
jgi:hypothetical protein